MKKKATQGRKQKVIEALFPKARGRILKKGQIKLKKCLNVIVFFQGIQVIGRNEVRHMKKNSYSSLFP